jgi:hypothetical protein
VEYQPRTWDPLRLLQDVLTGSITVETLSLTANGCVL